MKKTFVRLLALVLSLVMCFGVAACGSEEKTDKTPSKEEETFDDLGGDKHSRKR